MTGNERQKQKKKGRKSKKWKKEERNDVGYLRDVLMPGLGMREYVLALNRTSVRHDNSSTIFYFLRQEKYSLVCGSSEHEILHKRTPHTQNHKSHQLYSVS